MLHTYLRTFCVARRVDGALTSFFDQTLSITLSCLEYPWFHPWIPCDCSSLQLWDPGVTLGQLLAIGLDRDCDKPNVFRITVLHTYQHTF